MALELRLIGIKSVDLSYTQHCIKSVVFELQPTLLMYGMILFVYIIGLTEVNETAVTAFRQTYEKAVGIGYRIDLVFNLIRLSLNREKQVMMSSRNLLKDLRVVCKMNKVRIWLNMVYVFNYNH